jgi:REP element-mobilizing transposase RayT
VVSWADVFFGKCYRDILLESLAHYREEKGMFLFGFVGMTNNLHLIIQQKEGDLLGWISDFKKFTSKRIMRKFCENRRKAEKIG